jgi:hypothetical protein
MMQSWPRWLFAAIFSITFAYCLVRTSGDDCPRPAMAASMLQLGKRSIDNGIATAGAEHAMWEPLHLAVLEPIEAPTRLEEPVREKLRNLAADALAIESSRVSFGLQKTVKLVDTALGVLADVDAGLEVNAEEVEYLEEHIGSQSAESAVLNHVLMTASDTADSVAGLRGEDLGIGPVDADYPNASYQGDMIAVDSEQLSLFQEIGWGQRRWIAAGRPWAGGIVSYCFASDTSKRVKHVFEAAVQQYTRAVPCLKFENVGWKSGRSEDARKDQACQVSPAIFVISRKSAGCYSYVGVIRSFTSQQLQLNDPGCLSLGIAIHELGHALGMAHEQSRPDRDKAVRILWDNVKPGYEHDFKVENGAYTGLPYDFLSIMQYDPFAFAKDRKTPTIVRADGSGNGGLGNRIGLSSNDVRQVAIMYQAENSKCRSMTKQGMGCIDRPNDAGVNVCTAATQCDASLISLCCGCGGGVKVQCYEGGECPEPPQIAMPESQDCIRDKTNSVPAWKDTYKCVFTNQCSFSVSWKCPSSSCRHTTAPGGIWHMKCNGKVETEICSPGVCSVHKA